MENASIKRILTVLMVVMLLAPAAAEAEEDILAQMSSSEKAVFEKILKLKRESDALMRQPAATSERELLDRALKLKGDMNRLLLQLPPRYHDALQKALEKPEDPSPKAKPKPKSDPAASQTPAPGSPQPPGEGGPTGGMPPGLEKLVYMRPEDVKRVEQALMSAQLRELRRIGMLIQQLSAQQGTLDAATRGRWVNFVEGVAGSGMEVQPQTLVQYVLHAAYAEATQDLGLRAAKVAFYNNLRAKIRAEILKTREIEEAVAGAADEAPLKNPFKKKRFLTEPTPDGTVHVQEGELVSSKGQLAGYAEALEQQLQAVGNDAGAANTALQQALQNQQQTLQTVTNVSKMLKDAATAAVQGAGP